MPKDIGPILYSSCQRERFRSGLYEQWANQYPAVFDDMDRQIARSQAGLPMGYHFFEWLAAVVFYHTLGYPSLLSQYEYKSHTRKQAILRQLVCPETYSLITDHRALHGRVQCPDLLVYAPDYSAWFFCEVKGPHDLLRPPQIRLFNDLEAMSGSLVRILHFRQTD